MTTPAEQASLPPPTVLYQLATGYYLSRALNVAVELNIADHLRDGPRSAEALAEATDTHAPSLRRVLRLLATAAVFEETPDGRFALTPLGDWLRSDVPHSFRSGLRLFTGDIEWDSWRALLHTVRTGETALDHVFGMPTFEYLAKHPEEAAVFDDAMAAFTSLTALAVAGAYDFSSFKTVVDVGGGNGALLIGILKANPHLRGIVFDQPDVVTRAGEQIARAGLAERCSTQGGDFFKAVPSGGDAYLIKHVIHDWDDARAETILRNCCRAMPAGAPLLVVEGVYPERVDQSLPSRGAALNDVNMLVVSGGKQRSEREFRKLFEATGFDLSRIIPTPASSIIEALPRSA